MRALLFSCLVFGVISPLHARTWTSANGGFQIDADAIAFDDSSVILKRESGKLVAVSLAELSKADQDFVRSKEFGDELTGSIEAMQTWTSKDGLKIRGRVLAFGRKDLVLTRQRGKVMINETPFPKLDPLHQKLALKIIGELEGQSFDSEASLTAWVRSLDGQPKSYTLEGVLMQLESGDQIPVPFFLFSPAGREVLQPGWQAWSRANEDDLARQRESLLMQTEAAEYQRQTALMQQQAVQSQQIEILKLNLLAASTGVTSIWEVGLMPGPGVFGRPTTLMVTAPNSAVATQLAMQQAPGYQLIGVRRASRF